MITATDVVLALSNSGETAEIVTILPIIKRLKVPLIAMTGNALKSTLAQAAIGLYQRQRGTGSLPARPGADRQHHGGTGHG